MRRLHYIFLFLAVLGLSACGGAGLEDESGSSSRHSVMSQSSANENSSGSSLSSQPSSLSSVASSFSSVSSASSRSSAMSSAISSSSNAPGSISSVSSASSVPSSSGASDEIIYNGESKPFVAASAWDDNGSTIVDSNASPYSGANHLRLGLTVSNWWGGVAYVPNNWGGLDWSGADSLRFRAKANTAMNMAVALYDGNDKQSTSAIVSLGTGYAEYSVALGDLGGVALNQIMAIVFASSGATSGSFTVDIDDIVLHRAGEPEPTPTPEPIAWDTNVDKNNPSTDGKKFRGVDVVDKDYLMVHFVDGEVSFVEDTQGPCAYTNCVVSDDNTVVTYGEPLNTAAAALKSRWHLSSEDDAAYGVTGLDAKASHRKSKLNGMAQQNWVGSDFQYGHTMEHWIYLELPSALVQGKTYTLQIAPDTNTDIRHWTFTYDIFNSRSEAVHINLAGYDQQAAVDAADLYIWMGDGGARDYSSFEGNKVYLYNVATGQSQEVGQVQFWKASASEAQWYNFTRSSVWNVDFSGSYSPGVYRLAIEGVGASQDFEIGSEALFEPFRVSVLGFFYMRIGQDSMDMTPVPRRPLWIPGQSPADTKVIVTDMNPYHKDWAGNGDRWDQPSFFAQYVKPGSPENPNAVGGHSDALDWDRHLGHVSIIYDMLLPYILTDGAIGSDDLGIAESSNGIPDIVDEARNEVDFWLSLRYEGGYSHGLTNPDSSTHILYQAGNTAIAAWANAVNASMLAQALRIAGATDLAEHYLAEAEEAWNYASALEDQMLDETQGLGAEEVPGRDFRITAAAWLYNLTGNTAYEDVINSESLITSGTSEFMTSNRNQYYAMAAYLTTKRTVHYPTLQANMRSAVIYQAKRKETAYMASRPSRRSTDNNFGYFHTAQFVLRTILAHSVATDAADRNLFARALELEAGWGLGRNPANMIQMTTATTALADKRSVENCYTSGGNDGTPGMHPGHTPYLNIDDWGSMIMAKPSWMTSKLYPSVSDWPRGEIYFNTRYVWAHSEFTPQQTMRGKMALYGYLLGISL